MRNVVDELKAFGLNKVLSYMDSDYEKNVPKILDWLERLDREGHYSTAYKMVREIMNDPDNNWNIYIKSIFTELDKDSRKKLLENFIVNASLIGNKKRTQIGEKEGCNVPWAVLLDPTTACNLKCTGCWAAEYGNQLSLDYDLIDRIITESKELGIHMFIYTGGEPLVRKKDIISLCEKHSDCYFLSFTNGTLIDEEFADEMKRVHNFLPAISIEGFEKENDSRRGAGTYEKIMRAMDILKERQLPFGISVCYTSQNVDAVGSDEFIDFMVEKGSKFCWYFTYMPIGNTAPLDLMATADQREFMYDQVRRWRDEKPMFIMDFWNDGEYVNGCIAGGRQYLHINANGDVEPCVFIHYSNANIKETSLLDALKSPLFMEYHNNQPFNDNHLRPCPLLDNNGKLAELVHRSGAKSTDLTVAEDVDVLCAKCKAVSENWKPKADRLWENSPRGQKQKMSKAQNA